MTATVFGEAFSGTEGFTILNSKDFIANYCLITDCSFNLSTIENSSVKIENSIFVRNDRAENGFFLLNSDIEFVNTKIDHHIPFLSSLLDNFQGKGLFRQQEYNKYDKSKIHFTETLIEDKIVNDTNYTINHQTTTY